jgi:hypothetical protein
MAPGARPWRAAERSLRVAERSLRAAARRKVEAPDDFVSPLAGNCALSLQEAMVK